MKLSFTAVSAVTFAKHQSGTIWIHQVRCNHITTAEYHRVGRANHYDINNTIYL